MERDEDALDVLTREESIDLLASASIGRVVFTDGGLPAVRPVTFVLDGDTIVFRTSAGSTLATKTSEAVVAFEVDDAELALRAGWSVCVCGRATTEPISAALASRLHSWAPGTRDRVVRIPLTVVTGRRIRPHPGGTTHMQPPITVPEGG